MIIDKTHSKRDLIQLFKTHNVSIDENQTKSTITGKIEEYVKDFKYCDYIKNETELKKYLKSKSPKQRPTATEKADIMYLAKRIINWAKNDYILSTYQSIQEPYNDIMKIYKWGDLPSVRRACRLYNQSPHKINHINPIISRETEKLIQNDKTIRQDIIYKLKIRYATEENPIILDFS